VFIADDGTNGAELWALNLVNPVTTPPVVTLAVSPASVTEDGPANLVFTFSRTGNPAASLSVSFSLTGTATEGFDFAALPGSGQSVRTAVFPAGSSTTTVSIDPTSDTAVEPDETVSLTLLAGTGYTLGTPSPVVGTIGNDDVASLQVVTLAAAPPPVSEDGPEELLFGFVRTGDITQPLSVGFTVGGSAASGTDYVVRGATAFGTTSGSVTIAAGSSVALLAIDPLSDTKSDGDELVTLSVTTGAGYSVGTVGTASGTILDNDVTPGSVVRSPHTTYYNGPSEASRFENGNLSAFAALKTNGSVVVWGNEGLGGDHHRTVASLLASDVVQVFSNLRAFAALKTDGSLVTWGEAGNGGKSTAVAARLTSGVAQVSSSGTAFAALKTDGSVVTWGNPAEGGDSTAVTSGIASGVIRVFAAETAFAALKTNGAVVTWGAPVPGGNSTAVASRIDSGVVRIFAASSAFAALKGDGSVVTWGAGYGGGDSSLATSQLASGVVRMFANRGAFAALKDDGSVVTWGNSFFGGDSSGVASLLTSDVIWVQTTQTAFAALKANGSVVTWGDPDAGGSPGAVAAQLGSGTTGLYSNRGAFAALKANGSVVAWGVPETGGTWARRPPSCPPA